MNSILYSKASMFTVFAAFILLIAVSCNKKFDEPPLNADPDIEATMTISELKARYRAISDFQTIEDDKVISGIVTADDRTGNFFKQIVIQDETGGIPIIIDVNSLYTMYPVGRRVYVKLKGLMLGDYGGTIQLGLDSARSADGRFLNLGRIPEPLVNSYIIKGSFGNVITPKIVKPSEFTGAINDPLLSMFVQINNAEFRDADLVKTYANAANPDAESARNFTIKPCNDTKSIVLRNSSYASFAGFAVPQGNGPLVGISSVFNGTIQMTIRDTSDVQFKGSRCSGQTPVGTTKTITELLQYATGDSVIPAGVWIEGVIVSDIKNEASGNYRLQDGTAGIQIRFANDNYPSPGALNDKLKVYVGGYRFSIFNGGLQINGADVSTTTGTGTVAPRTTTVAQVIANMRAWESTLVTINNVTMSQASTSSTGITYNVTDATGVIATFVRNTSGITMYENANIITGYVSVFQPTGGTAVPQLTLRTQADIVGGSNNPPSSGGGIELGTTSPLLINFDDIGSGLPTGVKAYTGTSATAPGTEAPFTTVSTPWNNSSGAFKNFASGTGLTATTSVADQASATNRAFGLRQTGSFGDPGGAFVFVINNTTGKSNLKLDFLLQSLDATATGRTVTWRVDYAVGENPASFTALPTTPSSLTTAYGNFASTPVSVDLPAALNNNPGKVWIRIVTYTASTGSGSRPSTAIDDFKISW